MASHDDHDVRLRGGGTAASRGGSCRTNSFVPGTAVLMADGSYKAAWDNSLGKSGTAAPELDVAKLTNCS